ncbi:hypothetical protein A3F65_00150 [Candidatus Saccharibacteria bacterium RIFCSPHIGHO2_12_FULL_47_16b]|nr:MAG: hypothetical protein A3F65_00150 [Candidatus Saccharibacteria bacterium RIFCSPHIGHO2_12_FULL_47_16b]
MPKPGSKQTIAVDLDDVLAANAEAFINFTNKRWNTNLTVDDFDEHWAKVWQVEHDEERKRALEFLKSGIVKKYRPFIEALPVLRRLGKDYNLVVLTSRVRLINKDTRAWLDKHFKGIFSQIHHAGIWDDWSKRSHEKIKFTKTDVANEIGADYLIDDQAKHCLAAAEAGIEALLFGDYSWNKLEKLPPKVTRVKNWQEVLEYFTHQNFSL